MQNRVVAPSVFGANDTSRTYATVAGTSWVHLIAR